jgi:hypothetical protein
MHRVLRENRARCVLVAGAVVERERDDRWAGRGGNAWNDQRTEEADNDN